MTHHRTERSFEALVITSFLSFAALLSSCSLFGPDAPDTIPAPPRPDSPAHSGFGSPSPATVPAPGTSAPPPVPAPSNKNLITLEALEAVHVLILDAQGVERQWQQLRAGERMPFLKQGSVTITYSSGKALRILDDKDEVIVPPLDKEGIAIRTLP